MYASWTKDVAWSVWPGDSCASSLSRERAQLIIDQRQKLLGRLRIALLNCGQDLRNVGHRWQYRRRR